MTRLNFTGRQRITRERIRLQLRMADATPVLDVVRLDLSSLNLSDSSPVVVEAYRRATYIRLDAGTVGNLRLPSNRSLPEFEAATEPLFRIKVVGSGEDEGKLLAVADRLRARIEDEADGPQSSLLSIAPHPLGQRLWKLDLSDDDPQILVNSAIGDWKGFASTPEFAAFVLPEAFRQIIDWVIEDPGDAEDDDQTPRAMWTTFISENLGRDLREVNEMDRVDKDLWVDTTVEEFCSRHRLLDAYEGASQEED